MLLTHFYASPQLPPTTPLEYAALHQSNPHTLPTLNLGGGVEYELAETVYKGIPYYHLLSSHMFPHTMDNLSFPFSIPFLPLLWAPVCLIVLEKEAPALKSHPRVACSSHQGCASPSCWTPYHSMWCLLRREQTKGCWTPPYASMNIFIWLIAAGKASPRQGYSLGEGPRSSPRLSPPSLTMTIC